MDKKKLRSTKYYQPRQVNNLGMYIIISEASLIYI